MKIIPRLTALSLLLLAGSFSWTARASDGRIPISAVPYTISAPGVYYLTQDLTIASTTAITIASSKVTLDLNGHSITNSTASGDILSSNGGYTGIRVTNGSLFGGNIGILFLNVTGGEYQLDHLLVSGGAGVYAIAIGSNAGTVPATHAVVESVRVESCAGAAGIQLQNVFGGRITGSSVRGCLQGIVLTASHGTLVDGNTVTGSVNQGVVLANIGASVSRDNLITNNVVHQNGGPGVQMNSAHGNRFSDNNISENAGGGISLVTSNFNDINRNTITVNTGDGIRLNTTSRNNSFDWNVVSGNTGWGLDFFDVGSTANIYSYNRFAGNTTGAVGGTVNVTAGGNNAGGGNF